jgi:asparagine synthase (glutamine-hydrolysing)
MCGIAGIVGPGARRHQKTVSRMLESLAHRGPDGEGLYVAPSGLCVLGHRRLSILDLTDAAAQPMLSADRKFAISYNGELYNFIELKNELTESGERFHSSGDTEVLLRLLIRRGIEVLPHLNGMFAFALWDEQKKALLLARDRFGQKPLYITRVGNLWLFASEIRALLATGLVRREADPVGVLGFLSYGAVQGPSTIVKDISLFPKASYQFITAEGGTHSKSYWLPPAEKQEYSPETLRSAFEAAVQRHLISDAPIGLFLSGGIDSSAVTLAASMKSKEKVSTLTVVFPDQPGYSETRHARRVADLGATDHHEVPLSGESVLSSLPAALQALDQPSVDGINTYVISEAARQAGLKSILSGLGGDELFGGYPSFHDIPRVLRIRCLLKPIEGLFRKLVELGEDFSRVNGKLLDLMHSTNDLADTYLARRRLFTSRQMRRLVSDSVEHAWRDGISDDRLQSLNALLVGRALPDAVGLLEMDLYMGETLLRDSDVMGMAHGLEIRMPFLDADFSAYSLSLPPEVRAPNPFPKHFFVKAFADLLPTENSRRSKQGFALPFEEWLLNELRSEVQDGIESLRHLSQFFNGEAVQRLWQVFCQNPKKVGWTRPWSLFVLARYLKHNRLDLSSW